MDIETLTRILDAVEAASDDAARVAIWYLIVMAAKPISVSITIIVSLVLCIKGGIRLAGTFTGAATEQKAIQLENDRLSDEHAIRLTEMDAYLNVHTTGGTGRDSRNRLHEMRMSKLRELRKQADTQGDRIIALNRELGAYRMAEMSKQQPSRHITAEDIRG